MRVFAKRLGPSMGWKALLDANPGAASCLEQLEAAGITVAKGSSFTFGCSTFEAHAACGITTPEQVTTFADLVRQLAAPDASHAAIVGYAIPVIASASRDKDRSTLLDSGYDDDGENGGGRRLMDMAVAAVLQHRERGGVALTATRYYGGQIGKKRWMLLRQAAESALDAALSDVT